MPQSKHPEGPELRQAQGERHTFTYMNSGWVIETHDYGYDVGYLHRGDYALWAAGWFCLTRREYPRPSQSIGRYLDGEEEREGLYR